MTLPMQRHRPFYYGLTAGVVGVLLALWLPLVQATVIGANAFFAVYLGMTLAGLRNLTPQFLKTRAASADEPVWIIFLVTLGAVVAAIASLFVLVNRATGHTALDLALALCAVPLGWFTIHMMAAMHYAHVFWQPDDAPAQHRRGLEFPGTKNPDGLDFVYFAYVTGMTAQTSDVAITTGSMRRINLIHGIASFFFNTVLVAAAVNVAVSLGN